MVHDTKRLLVGACSVTALITGSAIAQDDADTDIIQVQGRRISDAGLSVGLGEATNTVAVTREELLSAPPGISGLKMLERLPGFNVQTDGALGLYEFGNSVTVRAYRLEQIGFILDGVPMGRPDAFGGSPIFRYVDNENLGSVVASLGAGDVSKPGYASLGPVVTYSTTDISETPSVTMGASVGDFDFNRNFVKLETGRIGPFSAYVSRSKIDSELWRGPGTIDREHIEAKGRIDLDEATDTYLQATFVYNDFFDFDSQSGRRSFFEDGGEDLAGNSGRDRSYIGFVPDGCNVGLTDPVDFNNDGVVDGNDFQPVSTGGTCTTYFGDRVNVREDALGSLMFNSEFADGWSVNLVGYYEEKDGFGVSPDSYSNSLRNYQEQVAVGVGVTHPRGVQYGLSTVGGERYGAVLSLGYEVANHAIEFGAWFEDDTYNRTQLRPNKTGGSPAGAPIRDEIAYFRRDYQSTRESFQYWVKDNISLLDDKLNLELSVKGLSIDYELDGFRDFDDYSRSVGGVPVPGFGPQVVGDTFEDLFLPAIGAVYDINGRDQFFASYSENYALPPETDSLYDNAISFDPPSPAGEEATNYEIGFRTVRPSLTAAVAVYYSSFDNRIVGGSVFNPATEQPETFSVNAGETTAKGVELSGVFQPEFFADKVFLDFNLTYNRAELEDGFNSNAAGNRVADSPLWLFNGGVTYEPSSWFVANLTGRYTGERFADFDEGKTTPGNIMEAYWLWSAYLDLGGENNFNLPENVNVRLNVDNIFDEDTLAFSFTTTGTGNAFFRPLSPRTIQLSVTARF